MDNVQHQVNQSNAMDNITQTEKAETSNGNKKKVLVPVIAVALVAVIAATLLIVLNRKKDSSSEQEKLIDEYFEAINNKDIEKIYDIAYIEEIKDKKYNSDYSESTIAAYQFFTNDMGFAIAGGDDKIFTQQCCRDSYPDVTDNLSENMVFKKRLDMLKVSYEIIDIEPFENVNIDRIVKRERQRLSIEDIEKLASYDGITAEIEDVDVAFVKSEWRYDDMLYGFDADWWKESSNMPYETYDEAISFMKYYQGNPEMEYVYTLILYKADDEWHILRGASVCSFRTWKTVGDDKVSYLIR